MKKISLLSFVLALISMLGLTVYANPVSISVGKSYVLSGTPGTAYPDNGKILTDGLFAEKVPDSLRNVGTFVGVATTSLDENGMFSVTVDLGEATTDIVGFDLHYGVDTDASVYAPEYCEFAISEDGQTFKTVSKVMSGEETTAGIVKAGTIKSRVSDAASGRYVRFTVKNPNFQQVTGKSSGWMFIDEVSVLKDDGSIPETGDTVFVTSLLAVFAVTALSGTRLVYKGKKQKNK